MPEPRRVQNCCPACGGEGQIETGYREIDRNTGAIMERWDVCELCGGDGWIEEDAQPVTEADIDEAWPLESMRID